MANRFRAAVAGWPARVEVALVILIAFGSSLVSSAYFLFFNRAAATLTEQHLRSLLIFEPAILLLLGAFLALRGWTFKRIGLSARPSDPLIGLGMALGIFAVYVAVWALATAAGWQPSYLNGKTSLVVGHLALPTVIAVCLVNPLFEELFVCGYLITLAKERGHLAWGVNASVALRLAYHLYQGGIGVVGIVPFGLICALWFSKTGRLWPVVIAHCLTDLTGLLSYIG